MKTRQTSASAARGSQDLPDADSLAALRAWYEGSRRVKRSLGTWGSARSTASLRVASRTRTRAPSAGWLRAATAPAGTWQRCSFTRSPGGPAHARAVARPSSCCRRWSPEPLIGDDVAQWLPPRPSRRCMRRHQRRSPRSRCASRVGAAGGPLFRALGRRRPASKPSSPRTPTHRSGRAPWSSSTRRKTSFRGAHRRPA